MKRQFLKLLTASVLAFATAAMIPTDGRAQSPLKVGVSGGDGEILWSKVKEVAKRQQGLDIQVVVFNDYLLPNAALDAGDLYANAFQHKPFLDNQIKTKGYKILAVGDTIVAPIGLYSRKVEAIGDLKLGAAIGIPNDPSNGGRALLLLQSTGLIGLKDGVGILPSPRDITGNSRGIKIREIDAAQLPRSLDDLDAAVINTNYATQAGLKPGKDSIAIEATKNNPYGNVIAVRIVDKDNPLTKQLVQSFQNDEVRQFILQRFDGALLPVF